MRVSFYPTDNEKLDLMELVYHELKLRGGQADNFNVQEDAFREASAHGAMRNDNYFAL